jgi:excisionase family DNA binding protein
VVLIDSDVVDRLEELVDRNEKIVARFEAALAHVENPAQGRTIKQTAAALGVSVSSVESMVATGRIQSVLFGRRRIIPQAEIDRLLALPGDRQPRAMRRACEPDGLSAPTPPPQQTPPINRTGHVVHIDGSSGARTVAHG